MTVSEIDIINRALQRVGAQQIAALDEDSAQATEAYSLYESVRRAELRRNVWRFAIRKSALRAISQFNTKLLTFADWDDGTTFAVGDIATGSDGVLYQSQMAGNIANDPTASTGFWLTYFGPDIASEYVTAWDSGITYAKGDHAVGSDAAVYISLSAANINHDPTTDAGVHWEVARTADANDESAATATSFYAGEMVYIGPTSYLSLVTGNADTPPSSNWLAFATAPTRTNLNVLYPLDSGPREQSETYNVYRLPYGFLREAPADPLTPAPPRSMRLENNYIVANDFGPLLYRYGANIQDVSQFDPLFIEGLSCRVALELSVRLTQDKSLLAAIGSEYKQFMGDARTVNAIETGPVSPQVDDWLAVKVSGAYSPFQYD